MLDSEIGQQSGRVDDILTAEGIALSMASDDDEMLAREKAEEAYLAVAFVLQSDKRRYGELMGDLENWHTCGDDRYPTTLYGAYELLVNWKEKQNLFFPGRMGLSVLPR